MKSDTSFLNQKFEDWTKDISALANPIIIFFISIIYLGSSTIFIKLIISLLVNEIICSLIKLLYPKKRPKEQSYNTFLQKIDAGSFPSIHSSRITITYLTFFINTENTYLKVAFIFVILLVMGTRIILKKHYWIDVIGGFLIGFFIFYIFYKV